jgi:hypothetical protein
MNAIGRAAAAAILGALLGAACAAVFYAWHPAFVVEFDRDLPRNVGGVYGPERDPSSERTFAWTSDDAVVRLPGLDRRVEWTLAVRLRGGRAAPAPNPAVTFLADGVEIETRQTGTDFDDVTVTIPSRPERRGLTIGLRSSNAFVPGGDDPRRLGVMLDRLALTPAGVALVPRPALDAAALSTAAMGAAIALLGVTPGSAIGAAVLLGAGDGAVLARGFGPFTDYPSHAIRLGFSIAAAVIALALLTEYWRGRALRNTARFAAAFSAAALFLKLLVLLHPNMGVGDTMFHAHKFQGVLAGNLFFTSIAPGGYSFPYPPGLYVFASLFAGLVRRGAGDMALLRVICASADAVAGLLLYTMVARNWGNRMAGAMAVAIYHLMPLTFGVLTTGNMSNAFAQSFATGAFAIAALPFGAADGKPLDARATRLLPAAALAAVLLVAFLSHTGTLATLFASMVFIALLFAIRGTPPVKRAGAIIAIVTIAAAAVAVAVYYARFMPTYRAEFARIGHETATAAPAAGGRTIANRLAAVPYSLGIYFGAPVLLFAFVGSVELARRRTGDRLTLALAGWALACVAFLVLGILTPVDMRYYLAALPAAAIAAGYGAAWAWSDAWPAYRTLWRVTAALFLAATISTGFHAWWSALG